MKLYPALRIQGKVIKGVIGDTHNVIGADNGYPNPPETARGFTPDGKLFLSRQQALSWLRKFNPFIYKKLPRAALNGLHSEHLAAAYGVPVRDVVAKDAPSKGAGETAATNDDLSTKTVIVYDRGGLYLYCAEKLAEKFGKVMYFLADADAYPTSQKYTIGEGLTKIKRVHDFWKHIDEADLICFFDCYDGELQHWLRSKGYVVYGTGRGEQVEIDKIKFLELLEELGLPCPKTYLAEGMEDLKKYLEAHDGETLFLKNLHRGDFECFDGATQILTDQGWRYFKDISVGDLVLTRDMESGVAYYTPTVSVFSSVYSGSMYHIKNAKIDLLVTPDHKFFHWTQARSKKWKYASIKEIISGWKAGGTSFKIPRNFKWVGEEVADKLIVNTYPDRVKPRFGGDDYIIDMDAWLEFCGWFASEGCLNIIRNSEDGKCRYRVILSQDKKSNPAKYARIERAIQALGLNYQYETTIGFSIYNKPLWDDLRSFYKSGDCPVCGKPHCAHIKQVPQYIKELAPRQIELFLASFLLGDGYISKTAYGEEKRYGSSSHTLVGDIQELLFRAGKTGNMHTRERKGMQREYKGKVFNYNTDEYYVSEGLPADITITNKMVSKVQYEGMIYDVTVEPHHSIFVKRNDKCCWSGNSRKFTSLAQSRPFLDDLKKRLGSAADTLEVLVQHKIDAVCEAGIDTFCVDGEEPDKCIIGYEIKDTCFVAKVFDSAPPILKIINDKFAPIMKKLGCRGNYSTEIRITKDGQPYYIDASMRVPSPPGELICEIYENWATAVWKIAHGEIPELKPVAKYGAEVILTSNWYDCHELHVKFPPKYAQNIKLKNHTRRDGEYYCVPNGNGEFFGAAVAWGDTLEEAIKKVTEVVESIEADEFKADCSCFKDAHEQIIAGEKFGVKYD